LRGRLARDDVEDVSRCDMLIAFTDAPRSGSSRGGRHVELGIAIGLHKQVVIVGPRENLFCHLPQVRQCDTWDKCVEFIVTKSKIA
jgi:hypothetical protein